jgi:hypothetical protein
LAGAVLAGEVSIRGSTPRNGQKTNEGETMEKIKRDGSDETGNCKCGGDCKCKVAK